MGYFLCFLLAYWAWSVIGMALYTNTSLLLKSHLLPEYRFENISATARYKVTIIAVVCGMVTTIDVVCHWYDYLLAKRVNSKVDKLDNAYNKWLFK